MPIRRAAPCAVVLALVAGLTCPAAVARSPDRAAPALAGGVRSVDADALARVGRRIDAAPSTTIYEARWPDGTLELSDRPPAAGAVSVRSRTYALPPDPAARRRAEIERLYWQAQAEAFAQRRRERDDRVSMGALVPVAIQGPDAAGRRIAQPGGAGGPAVAGWIWSAGAVPGGQAGIPSWPGGQPWSAPGGSAFRYVPATFGGMR